MRKVIPLTIAALLAAGCAAQHAPRVNCSGRLQEINPPQPVSAPLPRGSAPRAPTP